MAQNALSAAVLLPKGKVLAGDKDPAVAFCKRYNLEVFPAAMSSPHPLQHGLRAYLHARSFGYAHSLGYRKILDVSAANRTLSTLKFLHAGVHASEHFELRLVRNLVVAADLLRQVNDPLLQYASVTAALNGRVFILPPAQPNPPPNAPPPPVNPFPAWQRDVLFFMNDVYHEVPLDGSASTAPLRPHHIASMLATTPGSALIWQGHCYAKAAWGTKCGEGAYYVEEHQAGRQVHFRPDKESLEYPVHDALDWIWEASQAATPSGVLAWTPILSVDGMVALHFSLVPGALIPKAPAAAVPLTCYVDINVPKIDRHSWSWAAFKTLCAYLPFGNRLFRRWPAFFEKRRAIIDPRLAQSARQYFFGKVSNVHSYRDAVNFVKAAASNDPHWMLFNDIYPLVANQTLEDSVRYVLAEDASTRANAMFMFREVHAEAFKDHADAVRNVDVPTYVDKSKTPFWAATGLVALAAAVSYAVYRARQWQLPPAFLLPRHLTWKRDIFGFVCNRPDSYVPVVSWQPMSPAAIIGAAGFEECARAVLSTLPYGPLFTPILFSALDHVADHDLPRQKANLDIYSYTGLDLPAPVPLSRKVSNFATRVVVHSLFGAVATFIGGPWGLVAATAVHAAYNFIARRVSPDAPLAMWAPRQGSKTTAPPPLPDADPWASASLLFDRAPSPPPPSPDNWRWKDQEDDATWEGPAPADFDHETLTVDMPDAHQPELPPVECVGDYSSWAEAHYGPHASRVSAILPTYDRGYRRLQLDGRHNLLHRSPGVHGYPLGPAKNMRVEGLHLIDHAKNPDPEDVRSSAVHLFRPVDIRMEYPSNTPANMLAALHKRVFADPPMEPLVQLAAWDHVQNVLRPNLEEMFPQQTPIVWHAHANDYIDHIEPSKKQRAVEALRTILSNGLHPESNKLKTIELRLKTDEARVSLPTQALNPNGGNVLLWSVTGGVIPRTIAAIDPMPAVRTGIPIRVAQERFARLWPAVQDSSRPTTHIQTATGPVPVWMCYHGKSTPVELNKFRTNAKNLTGIHIGISGDDSVCYVNHGAIFLETPMAEVEGDASMFDQSQSHGPLSFERKILARLGLDPETCDMIERLARATYVIRTPSGAIRIHRADRPFRDTGGGETTLGNSLVMGVGWLYTWQALAAMTLWPATPALNLANIEAIFATIGLKMKLKLRPPGQATFLKGMWLPALDGQLVWAPLPSRVLKFGKSARDPRDYFRMPNPPPVDKYAAAATEFLRCVALGYSVYSLPPILAEMVAVCLPPPYSIPLEQKNPLPVFLRVSAPMEKLPPLDYEACLHALALHYGEDPESLRDCARLVKDSPLFSQLCHPLFLTMAVVDYN